MNTRANVNKLNEIYRLLLARYGHQSWWPAEGPFEVMVGAVLTQSAAWTNVETAINSLKAANALSPAVIRRLPEAELARLIYSCGYYNSKARKLKALVEWFGERCGDDVHQMRLMKTENLRRELLAVWGAGEETADSIILYAAEQPIFVIDAYTRRIIDRLGLSPERMAGGSVTRLYAAYQTLFMQNLPPEAPLFNEYHALFVVLGKNICRKKPLCGKCCLRGICGFSAQV